MGQKEADRRNAERKAIEGQVEFFVDSGILDARGVDISETGLGFTSPDPLQVSLVVTVDGEEMTRRARLVRVVEEDGHFIFGLEFLTLPPADDPS